MANALYGLGRERFLGGDLDWDAQDFRVILTDTADYTVSIDVHDMLDDVAAAARVKVSGALASKTKTLGVADAADVTLTAVTGDPCEALVIYQHTGVESTSALVGYIDTTSDASLPVTPNGGDITIVWDSGVNKIFKL